MAGRSSLAGGIPTPPKPHGSELLKRVEMASVATIFFDLFGNPVVTTYYPTSSTVTHASNATLVLTSSERVASQGPFITSDTSQIPVGSTSALSSATALSIGPTTTPLKHEKTHISSGTAAGIAVGVLAITSLTCALLVFFIRRHRQRRNSYPEIDHQDNAGPAELDHRNGIARAELESNRLYREKTGVELDAREIKRKPLLDSREITTKGRTELDGMTQTGRDYGGHEALELSANNQVVSATDATDATTENHYEAARTIHETVEVHSQPVAQRRGIVDDELLWLEQEEARMKESQARFQERKEQLLAQKARSSG